MTSSNNPPPVYRHYRGGIYRKLFERVPCFASDHAASADYGHLVLATVLHSNDRRPIDLVMTHDAYSHLALFDLEHRVPYVDHVVYVSLTYGSLFARPQTEFEGSVTVDGIDRLRFEPITLDDRGVYAYALSPRKP